MASSTDHDGSLVVSSNLTSTMKTLFEEKRISSCQEGEKYFWIPRNGNHVYMRVGDTLTRILVIGGNEARPQYLQ